MATRLYLTNSAAPFSPANNRGAWDQTTSAVTKYLGPVPAGAAATQGLPETSATNNWDVLFGRWVSDGAVAAGTLSGVVSWVIGFDENSSTANDFSHIHVYVTAGDTNTVRGTVLTDSIGLTEFPTTVAGAEGFTELDQTVTSVAVQAGDRLVVEVGYRAANTTSSSRTGTMYYGCTGDLDIDGGNTDVANRPAWVQFSDPNGLFKAVSPNERNASKNPAGGAGTTDGWATTNTSRAAVGSLSGFSRSTGIAFTVQSTAYSGGFAPQTPASVGEVWGAYVQASCTNTRSATVYFSIRDANGAFLSPNPSAAITVAPTPDAWSFVTITMPANAANIEVSIEGPNFVAGDVLTMTCVRFDDIGITTYRDGDSSGWTWDGTAELSSSHQLPSAPARPVIANQAVFRAAMR